MNGFLNSCFDIVWSLITILHDYHLQGVLKLIGKKEVSIKYFCREKMRWGFKHYMKDHAFTNKGFLRRIIKDRDLLEVAKNLGKTKNDHAAVQYE